MRLNINSPSIRFLCYCNPWELVRGSFILFLLLKIARENFWKHCAQHRTIALSKSVTLIARILKRGKPLKIILDISRGEENRKDCESLMLRSVRIGCGTCDMHYCYHWWQHTNNAWHSTDAFHQCSQSYCFYLFKEYAE